MPSPSSSPTLRQLNETLAANLPQESFLQNVLSKDNNPPPSESNAFNFDNDFLLPLTPPPSPKHDKYNKEHPAIWEGYVAIHGTLLFKAVGYFVTGSAPTKIPPAINLEHKMCSDHIPSILAQCSPDIVFFKPHSKENVFSYDALWNYLFHHGWAVVAHGDNTNFHRLYLIPIPDLSQWNIPERNVFIAVIEKKRANYVLK
jgi:hypothetical protein